MSNISKEIRKHLFELQDLQYREFHGKLMPTIDKEEIIGVRTPLLRKYAKEISKDERISEFLKDLPHKYYEENNLHAFIIATIKDFDEVIGMFEEFLPYINNWATCDTGAPKIFKKAGTKEKLLPYINKWINSDKTYTVRFAVDMLMDVFLDEDFKPEYARMVADIKSDEYYVKMVVAWYFATALAKQYDSVIGYIENRELDEWIHKKAIQKACESYRITKEQKIYLKTLK